MTGTLPSCFSLTRGWAQGATLDELTAAITWEQRTFRLYGREVAQPRLTSWMGDGAYTYSGQRHEPAPMPPIVATLRHELELRTGARFNSVLANLYRDGSDSVAWHADDEPELGTEPVIASLSFGAPREFQIRTMRNRRANTGAIRVATLELRHGDLLVMSGPSQRDYQHAVPKTARPVGPRINLTFRQV